MKKIITKYNAFCLLCFLVIVSLHACGSTQNIKNIYLEKIKTNKYDKYQIAHDYKPINDHDTAYVKIQYSGDMGIIHSVRYRLKDSLPDGKYQVYVNDVLNKVAHYEDGRKANLWVEYHENGERREIPYKNGEIKSAIREFYSNNKLKRISKFKNNSIYSRTTYFKSGKVKMKEFFENGKCIRVEKYNEDGKLEKKQRFTSVANPKQECIGSLYQENVIPTFKFKTSNTKPLSKAYLSDTLFIGFSESLIATDSDRDYLEFSTQAVLPSTKESDPKSTNTFKFFKYANNTYGLAHAEVNFPTSHYEEAGKDMFKVVKDAALIDIGISKQDFSRIFKTDHKTMCDSVKVSDDTSDSWYLFKNDKLHKIILTPYTD